MNLILRNRHSTPPTLAGPPVEHGTIHIVDDDFSFRKAVARVLQAAGYHVSLYESAKKLLENLPAPTRGCVLLDMQMPDLTGPQLQDALSKIDFELPIIYLTGHGDIEASVRAIKAGAEDFLTKPAPSKILLEAVGRALQRHTVIRARRARLDALRERFSRLTPREREVFALVVRGKLNKQIAYELQASERTVKAHRHRITEKLGASTVAELVPIAEALGVLADATEA